MFLIKETRGPPALLDPYIKVRNNTTMEIKRVSDHLFYIRNGQTADVDVNVNPLLKNLKPCPRIHEAAIK